MASRIGLAESSGMTINERDINAPFFWLLLFEHRYLTKSEIRIAKSETNPNQENLKTTYEAAKFENSNYIIEN
jgi:hypothetical protein